MRRDFYESKSVLSFMLLWCVLMGGLVIYLLQSCLMNLCFILSFFIFAILFLGKRYLSTSSPYITIDAFFIEHEGQRFLWHQIQEISLTPRFQRGKNVGLNLYLKIESKQETCWVNLKYFSDKDRRSLLDAIEQYVPVQYVKSQYDSNIQTFFLGTITFVSVFMIFALWFNSYITALGK